MSAKNGGGQNGHLYFYGANFLPGAIFLIIPMVANATRSVEKCKNLRIKFESNYCFLQDAQMREAGGEGGQKSTVILPFLKNLTRPRSQLMPK